LTCRELEALLHPYLDGELDAAARAEVDAHLQGCAGCQRQLQDFRRLHQMFQDPALRYTASDTLKQRLKAGLEQAAARQARRPALWAGAAAAAVFVGVITFTLMPRGGDDDDAMADAAIAEHAQSLTGSHLTDLTSADPKALQSWFGGKLAYSPPVHDLTAQGYALVGARLDHVKDQPAAALVYLHHSDYVTVFVCAAEKPGDTDLDADADSGFNIVYWTKGKLSFWVVGKLDPAELKRFGESLRASS
jgi:anti-sigma factor RsiW